MFLPNHRRVAELCRCTFSEFRTNRVKLTFGYRVFEFAKSLGYQLVVMRERWVEMTLHPGIEALHMPLFNYTIYLPFIRLQNSARVSSSFRNLQILTSLILCCTV